MKKIVLLTMTIFSLSMVVSCGNQTQIDSLQKQLDTLRKEKDDLQNKLDANKPENVDLNALLKIVTDIQTTVTEKQQVAVAAAHKTLLQNTTNAATNAIKVINNAITAKQTWEKNKNQDNHSALGQAVKEAQQAVTQVEELFAQVQNLPKPLEVIKGKQGQTVHIVHDATKKCLPLNVGEDPCYLPKGWRPAKAPLNMYEKVPCDEGYELVSGHLACVTVK